MRRWVIENRIGVFFALLLPLAALCIRFGPSLAGWEWNERSLGIARVILAAALLLWAGVWAVRLGDKKARDAVAEKPAAGKRKRMIFSLFLLPVVLCIRFWPLLAGWEWRVPYRNALNFAVVAALLLLTVMCFLPLRTGVLLSLPAIVLAVCMLFSQMSPNCQESVIERDGSPAYVRENSRPDDGGSLAGIMFYQYVNEMFRSVYGDFYATINPS